MEALQVALGVVLIVFVVWGILFFLYRFIKTLITLLYDLIRYGPREGWKRWNQRDIDFNF